MLEDHYDILAGLQAELELKPKSDKIPALLSVICVVCVRSVYFECVCVTVHVATVHVATVGYSYQGSWSNSRSLLTVLLSCSLAHKFALGESSLLFLSLLQLLSLVGLQFVEWGNWHQGVSILSGFHAGSKVALWCHMPEAIWFCPTLDTQ